MPSAQRAITVVTDSTAYLPEALSAGVTVVPLHVVIDGSQRCEGVDVAPDAVARALAARRSSVTTSMPTPAEFAAVYGRLLDQGADGVVSVHLSARFSGTYDAAVLAAADFDGRVAVVDSHSTGMGLGFCVVGAVEAAGRRKDLAGVRDAAIAAIARTGTLFYVDTLEFLRRGGRIGAASALLGTALSVKPILYIGESGVGVRDRVRTASRALGRLVDLAIEAAGDGTVDIAVHHLASPERAAGLADRLTTRLGDRLRHRYVTEVGAAVAAHVGPGMVCVVVHRVGLP